MNVKVRLVHNNTKNILQNTHNVPGNLSKTGSSIVSSKCAYIREVRLPLSIFIYLTMRSNCRGIANLTVLFK